LSTRRKFVPLGKHDKQKQGACDSTNGFAAYNSGEENLPTGGEWRGKWEHERIDTEFDRAG
jgi:hypothetical protein